METGENQKFSAMVVKIVEESQKNPPKTLLNIKNNSDSLFEFQKKMFTRSRKQCPNEIRKIQKFHPINEENYLDLQMGSDPEFNTAIENYVECFQRNNLEYLNLETKYQNDAMNLKMSLNSCFVGCHELFINKDDTEIEKCIRNCVHTSYKDVEALTAKYLNLYNKKFKN